MRLRRLWLLQEPTAEAPYAIAGAPYATARDSNIYSPSRKQPDPPPLPTERIDIRAQSSKEQNCHFLNLPLELRLRIYEFSLGGRLLEVRVVPSITHEHGLVRAACHPAPVEDLQKPVSLKSPLGKVHNALLRSCRQVYSEAMPVLYGHNTFHVQVHQFETVVLAGFGKHRLPDIHHIYLRHDVDEVKRDLGPGYLPAWDVVFGLLRQMRLRSLVCELSSDVIWDWTKRKRGVRVTSASGWGCGVLSLRELSYLNVLFCESYLDYPEYVCGPLREMLMEPNADELYAEFLQKDRQLLEQEIQELVGIAF